MRFFFLYSLKLLFFVVFVSWFSHLLKRCEIWFSRLHVLGCRMSILMFQSSKCIVRSFFYKKKWNLGHDILIFFYYIESGRICSNIGVLIWGFGSFSVLLISGARTREPRLWNLHENVCEICMKVGDSSWIMLTAGSLRLCYIFYCPAALVEFPGIAWGEDSQAWPVIDGCLKLCMSLVDKWWV